MLTLEAKRMGYRVVVLEPLPNSPTGQIADEQIVSAYDDLRFIGELGARTDVVTYEFENIPLASVQALEQDMRLVRPSGAVLRITQERLLEKQFLRDCGVDVADFAPVRTAQELQQAIDAVGFPAVFKRPLGARLSASSSWRSIWSYRLLPRAMRKARSSRFRLRKTNTTGASSQRRSCRHAFHRRLPSACARGRTRSRNASISSARSRLNFSWPVTGCW